MNTSQTKIIKTYDCGLKCNECVAKNCTETIGVSKVAEFIEKKVGKKQKVINSTSYLVDDTGLPFNAIVDQDVEIHEIRKGLGTLCFLDKMKRKVPQAKIHSIIWEFDTFEGEYQILLWGVYNGLVLIDDELINETEFKSLVCN